MSFTTSLGYAPAFSINKGTENVTGTLSDLLVLLKVESSEGGGEADIVDITIDDRGWNIAQPSIGDGSATLQVSMGYAESGLYDMGTFLRTPGRPHGRLRPAP